MTSSSQSFSSDFLTTRFSGNRCICLPPMPSGTSIYMYVHPDPYSQGNDAIKKTET